MKNILLILSAVFFFSACKLEKANEAEESKPSGGTTLVEIVPKVPVLTAPKEPEVLLRWQSSLEEGVHSAGGGYEIYHSDREDRPLAEWTKILIPYEAGQSETPNEVTLRDLPPGLRYFKVVSYSSFGRSAPSPSRTVEVPNP